MQKHVNCGAFGSVDKITCHMPFKLNILRKKKTRKPWS